MRRYLPHLLTAGGLLALGLVVAWLVSRPVVRFRLGPGEALVARPGVATFAVRVSPELWVLYDTASRHASDGMALPVPLRGLPALTDDGDVWCLTDGGLCFVAKGPDGEPRVTVAADEDPAGSASARGWQVADGARLEGLLAGRLPLLSRPADAAAPEGPREFRLAVPGADAEHRAPHVGGADGPASAEATAPIVCSPDGPAFAFRGEAGWEAWVTGDGGAHWRRFVADGCVGRSAVFAPGTRSLILDGPQGGLWYLHLPAGEDDPGPGPPRAGTMSLMAEGNLGLSRRVEPSFGFRNEPDRLVAPQWNMDGHLQIFETHLGGGGRSGSFNISFSHHYGVTLSRSGQLRAWCQSDFDESGDEPFSEELYLFDFDRANAAAVYLGSRPGGGVGQGPSFLGSGGSLVYIAEGDVLRIETDPEGAAPASP